MTERRRYGDRFSGNERAREVPVPTAEQLAATRTFIQEHAGKGKPKPPVVGITEAAMAILIAQGAQARRTLENETSLPGHENTALENTNKLGQEAIAHIFMSQQGLVNTKVTEALGKYGVSSDDSLIKMLTMAANLALLKTVNEGIDWAHGETYAGKADLRIREAIRVELYKKQRISETRFRISQYLDIQAVKEDLEHVSKQPPTDMAVAKALGMAMEYYQQAIASIKFLPASWEWQVESDEARAEIEAYILSQLVPQKRQIYDLQRMAVKGKTLSRKEIQEEVGVSDRFMTQVKHFVWRLYATAVEMSLPANRERARKRQEITESILSAYPAQVAEIYRQATEPRATRKTYAQIASENNQKSKNISRRVAEMQKSINLALNEAGVGDTQ